MFGNMYTHFNKTCLSVKLVYITRQLSLKYYPEMNKYISREGKFLSKFIAAPKKKRKLFFDVPPTPSDGKLNFNKFRGSKENSRRLAVLNTIFMKHISDMLVAGNIADTIVGKGLEITRVAMTENFQQLNVYWGLTKEENAAHLLSVLPDLGFKLRHELSQLKVMGNVPNIVFVKDKHYNAGAEVDMLLSVADFGEDHVLTPLPSEFNSDPTIESCPVKPPQEDAETSSVDPVLPVETMPVMRQDVLSLDHTLIMNKIMKSLKKSRASHRFQPNLAIHSEGNKNVDSLTNSHEVELMTKDQRRDALAKFVLERKIMKEKRNQNKNQSQLNDSYFNLIETDEVSQELEDFQVEDYIDEGDSFEDKKYN